MGAWRGAGRSLSPALDDPLGEKPVQRALSPWDTGFQWALLHWPAFWEGGPTWGNLRHCSSHDLGSAGPGRRAECGVAVSTGSAPSSPPSLGSRAKGAGCVW